MGKKSSDLVSNRKALHNFEILDTFEAGIVLQGTEVKSLRDNSGSLAEAYVTVDKDELWLIGSYIAPYMYGNIHNHPERRKRKLLMHKREIQRLASKQQEKGLAIVPLALYLSKGRVKCKIALARGKKLFDKRDTIKKREAERSIQREMKE